MQLRIPEGDNPSATVRKLLGPGGSHVRGIAQRQSAKLRARGIGTGLAHGARGSHSQGWGLPGSNRASHSPKNKNIFRQS
jgi:hypothetical protein